MVRCVVRPSITRTTQLGWLDFWSLVLYSVRTGHEQRLFDHCLPSVRPHTIVAWRMPGFGTKLLGQQLSSKPKGRSNRASSISPCCERLWRLFRRRSQRASGWVRRPYRAMPPAVKALATASQLSNREAPPSSRRSQSSQSSPAKAKKHKKKKEKKEGDDGGPSTVPEEDTMPADAAALLGEVMAGTPRGSPPARSASGTPAGTPAAAEGPPAGDAAMDSARTSSSEATSTHSSSTARDHSDEDEIRKTRKSVAVALAEASLIPKESVHDD